MLQESLSVSGSGAWPIVTTSKRIQTAANDPDLGIKITWSAVELDGGSFNKLGQTELVSQTMTALETATANDREELLIENIAPDIAVGSASVSDIQGRIERAVDQAAKKLLIDAPAMRLSLRGRTYDLRCYLGRNQPADQFA